MIPHQKHRLFNAWFAGHARGRIRGAFGALRVGGLEHALRAVEAGPVVLVANHTAWWDTLVVLHLTTNVLRADAYAMMDARSVRSMPFFRWIGCYGVERGEREQTVSYGVSLLTGPGSVLVVFPRGDERPITERPLAFRPGAAEVAAAVPGAAVLPLALRFEFGKRERPTAYALFGEPVPHSGSLSDDVAAQEAAVESLLAELEQVCVAACDGPDPIPVQLPGRRSLLGRVAMGALSLVSGRRRRRLPRPAAEAEEA